MRILHSATRAAAVGAGVCLPSLVRSLTSRCSYSRRHPPSARLQPCFFRLCAMAGFVAPLLLRCSFDDALETSLVAVDARCDADTVPCRLTWVRPNANPIFSVHSPDGRKKLLVPGSDLDMMCLPNAILVLRHAGPKRFLSRPLCQCYPRLLMYIRRPTSSLAKKGSNRSSSTSVLDGKMPVGGGGFRLDAQNPKPSFLVPSINGGLLAYILVQDTRCDLTTVLDAHLQDCSHGDNCATSLASRSMSRSTLNNHVSLKL